MNIIRTSAQIDSACQRIFDPELLCLLGQYAAALEEFGEALQAAVLIVEQGDTLAEVEQAYGLRLVADGEFTFPVEVIAEHARWWEVVWIIADDGAGLVLFIDKGADSQLIAACRHALAEANA